MTTLKTESALGIPNAESLAHWAQSFMLPIQNTEAPAALPKNLYEFGLKTPQDVVAFLRSPGGDKLIDELCEKLSSEARQMEGLQRQNLLNERTKALALLALLGEKAQAKERLEDFIGLQNELILEAQSKRVRKQQLANTLTNTVNDCNILITAINALYSSYASKGDTLKKLLKTLDKRKKQLEERYNLMLHELDTYLKTEKALPPAQIESDIEKLSKNIDADAKKIGELISNKKDAEATKLIQKQQAKNLRLACMKHILEIRSGERRLLDRHGESTDSYSQAAYLLRPGQTLIEEDGLHYLLEAGQDWNHMTPQEKRLAHRHFERNKDSLMTVKHLIEQNRRSERTSIEQQIRDAKNHLGQNASAQLLAQQNLQLATEARDHAQQLLDGLELRPSPTPRLRGNKVTPEMIRRFSFLAPQQLKNHLATQPGQLPLDPLVDPLAAPEADETDQLESSPTPFGRTPFDVVY